MTKSASNLLENVLNAAGGLSRWSQISFSTVTLDLSGATFALKGFPEVNTKPWHLTVTIDTKTPHTIIENLPLRGHPDGSRAIFTATRCLVESPTGEVLEERINPRGAYEGHDMMTTKWDNMHLVYFVGYALWNYVTSPFSFTLEGIEVTELDSHIEGSGSGAAVWRVLQVTYPIAEGFPAHAKTQRYFYDDKYMLRRTDYAVDVLGGTTGGQICEGYTEFGGITMPTVRKIFILESENGKAEGKVVVDGPLLIFIDNITMSVE